ncbi:MAG: SLC13 family permease [bacterium]|jgi:sodium-dependent dicarboxylate transporter 2/3/5
MTKALICVAVPLLVLWLPMNQVLQGIDVVQVRMLAIFTLAVLCWVLEPIPIFATSVLLIGLELLLISNKGPIWFRDSSSIEEIGKLLPYQDILTTFASPIIMLFLGGFFLAMAATKYHLDVNLARVFLRPFGESPKFVMLGMMIITAVFSMFMSNTATTALMITIVTPVLRLFPNDDLGRTALVLCIPLAANIGGIGTPIGSPPNAVAMKYLVGEQAISFGGWMAFGVPFSICLLAIAWTLLVALLPSRQERIKLVIESEFRRTPRAWVVYICFALTILLWLTGSLHGMNSYVVAMIPVAVFLVSGVIGKQDLKNLSWDVLWLISGGIALGLGLESTGLSQTLVTNIPFAELSPLMIVVMATVMGLLMSTFISNTATANLLLPIMATLGATVSTLGEIGGSKLLVLLVTFSCSLAMALPVSTPPNAMAYATGLLENRQLLQIGALISGIGLVASYLLAMLLWQIGFF